MEHLNRIIEEQLGQKLVKSERFTTGLTHFVFDVVTDANAQYVIRVARPSREYLLKGGLYWQARLEKLDIPLPKIIATGTVDGHNYAIYERLVGEDLDVIYPRLSEHAKRKIAYCVASIHQKIQTLPQANGFGHAQSYDASHLMASWRDVLSDVMDRTAREMQQHKHSDPHYVNLVREKIERYAAYLDEVEPIPFLYDLNIRNVIVYEEQVSGIIDVDTMTFGDPFLSIGWAKMSLLLDGYDTRFIDYWCEYWKCSTFQLKMVNLYAFLYCVRFMGTLGLTLNGNQSSFTNPKNAKRLEELAQILLKELNR